MPQIVSKIKDDLLVVYHVSWDIIYLVELRMNPFLHDTYSVTPSALYCVLYNKQKSVSTRKCPSDCSKITRYCRTSTFLPRRREPLDATSLRCTDTSLPDLLSKPNLSYAVMSMRNTSKCACVIQEVFKLV